MLSFIAAKGHHLLFSKSPFLSLLEKEEGEIATFFASLLTASGV
jgi:hypothetical protein